MNHFNFKQSLIRKYHKTLNVMRISILLNIILVWNVSANVFSQTIHFETADYETSIKDILKVIEKQTEYTFFYNDAFLDLNRSVKISRQNVEVGTLLNDLFRETELTYREE